MTLGSQFSVPRDVGSLGRWTSSIVDFGKTPQSTMPHDIPHNNRQPGFAQA